MLDMSIKEAKKISHKLCIEMSSARASTITVDVLPVNDRPVGCPVPQKSPQAEMSLFAPVRES